MQIIPKFAGTGQFDSVRASGATVSWGSTVNSAAGGQYRLCWCAAMGDCSDFGYFSIDVGELQVYGPTPLQQDRTCVSGRTCFFGASVHGANPWFVSILDTCGQNPDLLHGTVQVVGSSFASVSFDTLTASGGIYRLCWCASRDCSTANAFVVDAGKLELLGSLGFKTELACLVALVKLMASLATTSPTMTSFRFWRLAGLPRTCPCTGSSSHLRVEVLE